MSTAGPRDIIAPCPFCGGTANVYIYECQDPFVGCNGGRGDVACDANGPSMPTEAEAIARWNRRTPAAGYRVVREGDDGWQQIGDDHTYPPHDVPVLLWSPPSMAHPDGLIEARPFSTGRRGVGWSEYSQHSYATHWRPQPEPPAALRALVGEAK